MWRRGSAVASDSGIDFHRAHFKNFMDKIFNKEIIWLHSINANVLKGI